MPEDDFAPALPTPPDFLAHGGDMAVLISTLDRHCTRLGALQSWPASLKCVLSTVLGSPKAMYILWGPEFLFFFNDACAPLLGARLQGAMGRPFAQVWPELWGDFEPKLHQALAGCGSTYENMPLMFERWGHLESTWWTFSHLCLRDERGAAVGVHCIFNETTALVHAQAREAFWLDLASALHEAHTPEQLQAVAAQKLGRHLGASCVGYGEVDPAGQYCQVEQHWTAGGCASVAGTHRLDDFGVLKAQQLRKGQTVAVHDIARDPLTQGPACQASYRGIGCQAFINAPLLKEGRLAAVLFVLSAEPRVWTTSEQALVEEVAERTWLGLQRWQAEVDLRQSHQTLDHRTGELLHAENALRQSQKLQTLGQLTSGVAHDVNNLLAMVNASAELLRDAGLGEDQRSHYLSRIVETVARAAKLTGQLLSFARHQPLSPEVFDVGQRLLGVVDLVRPLLGQGVQVDLKGCEEHCGLAEADINQFETALLNLVLNARDAMDAQGCITVQLQQVDRVPKGPGREALGGDFVAISVRDTGCGIAADQLEAIFAPFHTTKAVGQGTGLGLSQVFDFARHAGGQIAVASEPGQGAVFTLYLPRVDDLSLLAASEGSPEAGVDDPALNDIAVKEPVPKTAASKAPRPHVAVLVVEDNDTLGEMTCELLQAHGYRAVHADGAAQALALLGPDGAGFDLVFTDVVMPGMSGMELGVEVRRRYPGLPVVLTSGYNAVMASEGKYGFEMVLKPYTLDALARAFDTALAAKETKETKEAKA